MSGKNKAQISIVESMDANNSFTHNQLVFIKKHNLRIDKKEIF